MNKTRFLLFLIILFCIKNTYSQVCDSIEFATTISTELPVCGGNDGSFAITSVSGGIAPYHFQFDTILTSIGSFFDLSEGIYPVIITDAKKCIDTIEVRLLYKDADQLIRPNNTFTPNDDGINDTWIISGIDGFTSARVSVFNRWGQLVYQATPYSNAFGWNGKQGNSSLPAATYYYVISIFNNCVSQTINGTVTTIK